MIWKGLMVVTGSESPIVVVLRFAFFSLAQLLTPLVEVWNLDSFAETSCFCGSILMSPSKLEM